MSGPPMILTLMAVSFHPYILLSSSCTPYYMLSLPFLKNTFPQEREKEITSPSSKPPPLPQVNYLHDIPRNNNIVSLTNYVYSTTRR